MSLVFIYKFSSSNFICEVICHIYIKNEEIKYLLEVSLDLNILKKYYVIYFYILLYKQYYTVKIIIIRNILKEQEGKKGK